MTGVNFAGGKAFVISSTSGFVYVYDMTSLSRLGASRWAPTSSSRRRPPTPQDEKIYLAESTNHEVIIIDAKTHGIERVRNVGLFPWGTHIMDSKDNYCH